MENITLEGGREMEPRQGEAEVCVCGGVETERWRVGRDVEEGERE